MTSSTSCSSKDEGLHSRYRGWRGAHAIVGSTEARTFGWRNVFSNPAAVIWRDWLEASMTTVPETKYAKSGDIHIAYQVVGRGPRDVVMVPGFVSHVEYQWEEPRSAHMLQRLASFSRLICFDKRGT